ncbi:MAG: ascorbate-dependent monooxygenase [Bryobacterales bacterium]|nr:ascorbate-dependent monooxygenase [Bryobacterales bacterium]
MKIRFILLAFALAAQSPERVVVHLFLAEGCPLSERFGPEIERLRTDFLPRQVQFDSNADPRTWGAAVTPSAVVTVGGKVRYRGRIDDRAASLGVMRPNGPTRADLRIALEEILAGKPVTVPETTAVGCAISTTKTTGAARPNYVLDVAPILNRHCVECHREGQSGPFALQTYEQARVRATPMAQAVAAGVMPPWLADPQRHRFQGERRLSVGEKDILARWAAAGAPAGDLSALAPPPKFTDRWRLGEPHAVVGMSREFEIPADGPDLYECFVVPANFGRTRYVRAFEFRPGNRRLVHHALLFIAATTTLPSLNSEYPCFGLPGFLPSGSLGGWTPGFQPAPYPPGTAVTVPQGARLVMQIHYHPIGVRAADRSEVALYFGDQKPERRMMDIALGSRNIDIPAGDARYIVRDHFTIPVDVEVTGIIPHAHYIAKEMRGWATLPSGERIGLITIRNWDFNWQQHFRYQKPFVLPAGTKYEMEFRYDNSPDNPRNPFVPPQRVVWGANSTDEMAGLHLQVIPVDNADAAELGQALWGKIMRELGGGIYRPNR